MVASSFQWSSGSRSHVGRVRKLNEDACLEAPEKGLWAVADGMGGHAVGDVASQMVVDSLNDLAPPSSFDAFEVDVRECIYSVNSRLRREASKRQEQVIGSTVAVLFAFDRRCLYLWAGDSRIYLYREGELRQLTRDHSQLEELIARGVMRRDEAEKHVGANAITRAVGGKDTLDLEGEVLEICDGDTFLLCSDGLYNEVSGTEIAEILIRGDCHYASDKLVDLALARGARDNVTAVVVRADDELTAERTVLNPILSSDARSAE